MKYLSLIVMLGFGLMTSVAHAASVATPGYYVATSASATTSSNALGSASYQGAGDNNPLGPYYSLQATPTASAGGTTDTTGLATSSWDAATAASNGWPAVPGLSAVSSAAANLSDGTVHASASNNGISS